MLFNIKNKYLVSIGQLHRNTLLNAYFIIQNYPLKASDILMDNYLQRQYSISLKNLCIKLLLDLTFYKDGDGNLILLFKDSESDALAQLITYGNGAIPGSKILQVAFR